MGKKELQALYQVHHPSDLDNGNNGGIITPVAHQPFPSIVAFGNQSIDLNRLGTKKMGIP